MSFKLQDFDHLRSNPMIQFKEEIVGGKSVTIICYMIANEELWKIPLAKECRGHVFDTHTGECLSLAFEKFWNINEREETLVDNIDWTKPFVVAEKKDGSMITAVVIDDKVYFKTKKSFYSDVAILANRYATDEVRELAKCLLLTNISPIFEFTHPDWKIVVDYGVEPTWTLLACRDIDTSKYYNIIEGVKAEYPNINIRATYSFKSYDEIKASIDTLEGMEGYVIEFEDGSRYKTKCNWYLLRHRVNTDLRERDVIKMIHNETIDDVKSVIIEAGHDLDKIIALEERYAFEYSYIVNATYALCQLFLNEPDKKSIALKYSRNVFFGMAIKLYEGRTPNFKEYWEKNYLKDYSLKTLYSDFNHVSGDS